MALVALEIPKVGLVMENARLVRWLKNVGDRVQQGEPLLELETEKSVVEIECTESGRLVEILLEADQEARVGDRVAWVENGVEVAGGAGVAGADAAGNAAGTGRAAGAIGVAGTGGAARAAGGATGVGAGASPGAAARSAAVPNVVGLHAPPVGQPTNTGRIKSSPVSRRLATEHAIDLRTVTGTGPRGRVQLKDVRRAIESQTARPQLLSSMRRALARSMTLSNATVPQFIVERAVDWTALHATRAKLRAARPAGTPTPSVNDFLLQAIARALLSFPALNATFVGDPDSPDASIAQASGAHIGLVVAVENGLLVPVLHGVERLGLAELARQRSEMVERALSGRLKREELDGATFSLSNLGARGPDRFTALINPPQSAILAVGRQRDTVIALNGGVHVRPMSQLALTVDHRVADGRLASEFLAFLVGIIEGDEWRSD